MASGARTRASTTTRCGISRGSIVRRSSSPEDPPTRASSTSRLFRSIADEVGAYLMVDMAHFAGLVARRPPVAGPARACGHDHHAQERRNSLGAISVSPVCKPYAQNPASIGEVVMVFSVIVGDVAISVLCVPLDVDLSDRRADDSRMARQEGLEPIARELLSCLLPPYDE